MIKPSPEQTIRERIRKVLNKGRSGDMDAFGCAEYNPELVDQIIQIFIDSLPKEKKLHHTWSDSGWDNCLGEIKKSLLQEEI